MKNTLNEKKCAVCETDPTVKGGLIYNKENPEKIEVVCGLHLSKNGKKILKKEISGEWVVFVTWGYGPDVEGLPADQDPMKYFDKLMDRVNQNTETGWGWKIVARVGDVALEASTFPKNGYSKTSPKPRPTSKGPKPTNGPVSVEGIRWTETNPGFAWAHVYPRGSDNPHPEVESILAAIQASEKGKYVLDGWLYKLGGDDKRLLNRIKPKKGKS